MRLDITDFKPQALYETDLHREQQSQNACALKAFLEAASYGEYSFVDTQCDQPHLDARAMRERRSSFVLLAAHGALQKVLAAIRSLQRH